MSTTAQQVFFDCMSLADEVQDTGTLNETDVISYQVRTPSILTSLEAELLKEGDISKEFNLSLSPIDNLLGEQFDTRHHGMSIPFEDLIFEANDPAYAYSFEVDGEGTVYIEDYNGTWNTLTTINVPDTVVSYTMYQGVVTPTAGATKSRVRFSGSYFYRTINRALFGIPLKLAQIPDYAPWVKVTLPSDFKHVDQLIAEYPDKQYAKDISSKWEQNKYLYVDYYFKGKIRLLYRPVPTRITALTDTLTVDDITARTLLPYALGMELFKEENTQLFEHFKERYQDLKFRASRKNTSNEEDIVDVY